MDDLISRQAAIDELSQKYIIIDNPHYIGYNAGLDEAERAIKALPPVKPKRGKWIDAVIPNDNGDLLVQVCDQCNTFFPLAYTGGGHHFCPNCGADMRGEAE